MNTGSRNTHSLLTDYIGTYSSALANGSIIPALFLCSVKQRLPEHFLRSVEVIGERIWDRRLPVCKGAHLSTCAREAGLTFLEAEEIISRLSHVDSKELLRRNSEEAVLLGASFAPLFVSSPEYSITFHNFHDFRTSLFNNRMNHSHTHIHKPK
ncbi:hypothetical protein Y032_0317g2320 [Ancylostoma ceylanicum]|nr:hypothetical protein Y032_0317g2320 [Ancylostoma ceylanicum]